MTGNVGTRRLDSSVGGEGSGNDDLRAFEDAVVGRILRRLKEKLIMGLYGCRSSYCIAVRLDSLYFSLRSLVSDLKINRSAEELFCSIIMDKDVVNVAACLGIPSDKIDILGELVDRHPVQLSKLFNVVGCIAKWERIVKEKIAERTTMTFPSRQPASSVGASAQAVGQCTERAEYGSSDSYLVLVAAIAILFGLSMWLLYEYSPLAAFYILSLFLVLLIVGWLVKSML